MIDAAPRLRRALCLATALWCTPVAALAYDPATDWHTLTTPRLRVHYAAGMYDQAAQVARVGEDALSRLIELLGAEPDLPIDIVLADEQDFAQGYAQNAPYNRIGLNAAPPDEDSELGDYDDWTYNLVGHELAHTVHVDTMSGLPRLFNMVFGKWFVPNAAQPRWFVEGLAVYYESRLTSAGRGTSSTSAMMLRTAILAEREWSLDELTGSPWRWPQGSAAYIIGGAFLAHLVERFGDSVLVNLSHNYGSRLVPWAINASLQQETGVLYADAYATFLAAQKRRAMATAQAVEAAGRREGRLLTDGGQQLGSVRVDRQGRVYFVESPLRGHAAVGRIDRDGRSSVVWVQGGAHLALAEPGQAIIADPDIHDTYRVTYDLYAVDLGSGARERLTRGARAQAPDVSADGARIVFVQLDGVHSVLRLGARQDLGRARVAVDLGPDTQVFGPRFSPDGTHVAFAASAGGQRDLYELEISSGAVRRLTSDRALDGGVSYSLDGEAILFHSDRDGIFNLYALSRRDGSFKRLSRVVGGAFSPEAGPGGRIYYRSYGAEGFDLAVLEDVVLADAPEAEAPPAEVRAVADPPRYASSNAFAAQPYSPWPSILPRAWLPLVGQDTEGLTLGASAMGEDVLGRHRYSAAVAAGVTSRTPTFELAYANTTFHPGVNLSVARRLVYAAAVAGSGAATPVPREVQWAMSIGTNVPLYSSRDRSLSMGFSYDLDLREPFADSPTAPTRFSSLRADLRYTDAQVYGGSISRESGGVYSLSGRLEQPWLGSAYSAYSATLAATYYLANPWIDRHVLAVRGAGSIGESNYVARGLFAVSGVPARDIVLDLLNGRLGAGGMLRGFPMRPYAGNVSFTGSAEYRLPLYDIEAGVDTLPIYFGALHGAVFIDAAAVSLEPRDLWKQRHGSVGFELRLDLLLGYVIPATVRFGWGFGLGKDSEINGMFLLLGSPF